MRKLATALAFGAIGLLTGCAPMVSLHPLVTEKEALPVDSNFTGFWKDCNSDEIWKVEASGDRGYSYRLIAKDADSGQARLVDLEGTLFADLVPDGGVLPAHILAKVRLEGDTLHLALLSQDTVGKAVAHETAGSAENQVILTPSTDDLRKFLLLVRTQPEFFDQEGTLCRVK